MPEDSTDPVNGILNPEASHHLPSDAMTRKRHQPETKKRANMTSNLAEEISLKTTGFIQSSNHRDLLDIVDSLRSHGVSHYVALPQIIVCGSQSSGKSSTLESLSGIAFPTAEGLCTRFATELILRRGERPEIKVHIQPGADRTDEERARLSGFAAKTKDQDDFPQIIEAAKEAMGLTGSQGSKIFSKDVLRIESTSPNAPNLTIVDLPGLFGASDKNQSDDDADLVQNLVVSYMRQHRSIILAVVAADHPFANQPVTKFAREIDPSGIRTLGLITKPDKIDPGTDLERYYVELAQNLNVYLYLGWHVLRNRSHTTAKDTIEERDEREAQFFSNSVWTTLDSSQLGVEALRGRLRNILWKQIQTGLPGVKTDVQSGIKDCRTKLEQLGQARSSLREKHTYLQRISSLLSTLVRAAIDGVYANQFFESLPNQQDAFVRRLRAHVQKILDEYAKDMRVNGHTLEIVEDDLEPTRALARQYTMRAAYLETVKTLLIECRARELPGTYNPMVVADLFSRQCKPWEFITQNLVEQIHEAAASHFNKIISEICDENTRSRLMKWHIQPALHRLRQDLKDKVDELLEPHLSIHPITYNDYLTKHVQEIQTQRHDRMFDKVAAAACGYTTKTAPAQANTNLSTLLTSLQKATRPDVREYSASLAADVAAAYYQVLRPSTSRSTRTSSYTRLYANVPQVALKKFIDDVSVNAIETCLIQRLPDVFCPDVVWDLSQEEVERLGSEDDRTVEERAELTKKLNVLENGLKELDAFTARTGIHAVAKE
ncbi:P-loop containing nucleoside triphosphate hydrolase protein [Durotheca rogersii]|uniref:P-loop containing nucleoside triphosphate hydrolase protein n=1 Tax=Durotheca rogersii TaxID=419775 RepID=UPI0022209B3E|nr:P-loop containing nucleoside triphosphate hydrolase protein [Durotheca rogersii]KAI5857492.1 P-loop containing nucleoside triphosphate hydrolase protein [Durotheca rogersii]